MTTEAEFAMTGAAHELANAGYVPMPDPQEKKEHEAIGSDNASLRAAAAERAEATADVTVRGYTGPDGEPAPPNEAVTLARASRDYADATAAERLVAESETSRVLAERVDALRAEALANDPGAAELFGFEPPRNSTRDTGGLPFIESGRSASLASFHRHTLSTRAIFAGSAYSASMVDIGCNCA